MSGDTVVLSGSAVKQCLATLAHHARSFHFASHALPPECRAEAAVLYAWCRAADDAIDLAPPGERPANLSRLVRELDSLYDGQPQSDLVLAAFGEVARARGLPREYPAELLAGLAMDLEKDRYANLDELLLYAFRVAGTVGLMMAHVLGASEPRALRNAAHLGIAMQLTNICRDVREDWERGRLYLPLDLLAQAGAPDLADQLGGALPVAARRALGKVIRRLLDEADRFYRSGDAGIAALSTRSGLAVRTARLVYAAIGERIAACGYDAWAGRAVVPLSRKLELLAKAVMITSEQQLLRPRGPFRPARIDHVLRYPHDIIPL
jgi:15-cis-phytoene synthase